MSVATKHRQGCAYMSFKPGAPGHDGSGSQPSGPAQGARSARDANLGATFEPPGILSSEAASMVIAGAIDRYWIEADETGALTLRVDLELGAAADWLRDRDGMIAVKVTEDGDRTLHAGRHHADPKPDPL